MDTFASRLKQLRLRNGLTLEQVGAECGGKSKSSISAWESETKSATPSVADMKRLARLYRITVDELVDATTNVSDQAGARVPVITLAQAAAPGILVDMHTPGFAVESVLCPAPHSSNTYALRINDPSMTSPTGPSYPEGRIVYCDASPAEPAVSGDRVVVRLASGAALVRELVDDSATPPWLRPLNPQYPRIDGDFTVLAKVIGSFVPE